jgi:flotillin
MVGSLLLVASEGNGVAQGLDYFFGKVGGLIVIFLVLGALALLFRVGASRYKKVPPDQALVVYGGGRTNIVTGGAVFVIPLLKDTYPLDLTAFQVSLELIDVPNLDRIPVTVIANATCRISNDQELLQNAARTFGRAPRQHIIDTIKNALEGHLRIIIGQMDMETILSKRDEFNKKVSSEAEAELHKLGCKIDILNIQKVTDAHGYIEALGKPKSAEVKAEAAIREAEQVRRQTIETSGAQKEAATVRAANDQLVADAERALKIKQAQIAAEVAAEQARASQAGPQAEAEASKAVFIAQVDAQKAKAVAEIDLQDAVGKRTEAELKATVLKQAEAEKSRLTTEAEGAASGRTIRAQAEASAVKIESDAKANQTRTVGTAEAEMIKTKGVAEAEATKARLLADAEGKKAQAEATKAELVAEAEGKKAQADAAKALQIANAEGAKQLIAAYANMTADQQKMVVVSKLIESAPALIEALGKAGKEVVGEYAKILTAAMASVDKITVYDTGGGGDGKNGALDRMLNTGPGSFYHLLKMLEATGLSPVVDRLLSKAGVDINALGSELPPATPQRATEEKRTSVK